MTKKNRIEYLICTLSVVVTGFIIYGFVGSIEPLINESKLQSFLLFGCLGGFLRIFSPTNAVYPP